MKQLKCIHFGSYWMGKNDIVYAMLADLKKTCQTIEIDVEIYNSSKNDWFQEDYSKSKTYPIRWLHHDRVVKLINLYNPDVIICNAGGLSLSDKSFQFTKKNNIITVGISLSDPDVFHDQGSHYYQDFDLFYTNSHFSLQNQYLDSDHVHLLPFAASTQIHKPMKVQKRYDVVVVGHARQDRIELIDKLRKEFKVKTFGKGWGFDSIEVQGKNQVKAINLGKVYLSFPQTIAGYTNVKVGLFEAAACKSCIVMPYIDEVENYFTYGTDILGYKDDAMLKDLLFEHLEDGSRRLWIAENAYNRVISEHTWLHRWKNVLNDIKEIR